MLKIRFQLLFFDIYLTILQPNLKSVSYIYFQITLIPFYIFNPIERINNETIVFRFYILEKYYKSFPIGTIKSLMIFEKELFSLSKQIEHCIEKKKDIKKRKT